VDPIRALADSHDRFLAFLERRVESREAAEDILQAAYLRGLEQAGGVPDGQGVVPWFYRVLRNAVVDHYRRRGAAARALDSWSRESIDREPPASEIRREICACVGDLVADLKPSYRQAIEVLDLGGGTLGDLAGQAGITAANAAVRARRARGALKEMVLRACGACSSHGCVDCDCRRPGVKFADCIDSRE
jgi:RNA polymerase sigma-70 factor (ECF subfamily)